MKKFPIIFCIFICYSFSVMAGGDMALNDLMNRLSPGLASRIEVSLRPDTVNYFRLSGLNGKPLIEADNRVSAASGLNHYLKYVAHCMPTWDCMELSLPEVLPLPDSVITMVSYRPLRYYLNYCTHSYSMPFWDEARWQREIDWMALHGINAVLTVTGTDAVWDATLRKLGYNENKIDSFIASPAYQAWWLMNNLEGEGATMTPAQMERQARLQQFIVQRMRALDIEPVFPGYSGMIPHDANEQLGFDVASPGKWCGYNRPAFLQPTDSAYSLVAKTYYGEQKRLYGTAKYYSMDPFHEGGNTEGVNLTAAARAIESEMEAASPGSVWLIQGWQENPRAEIIDAVEPDRMTVLDLHCETSPQWVANRHRGHPWVWCMLLNFGGNVGLHGKIRHIPETYNAACVSDNPPIGVGFTMEGIENNPVMFELVSELPWYNAEINVDAWLKNYALARYGSPSAAIDSAWTLLAESIYNAPASNRQQGTTESLFCARPSDNPVTASAWANSEPYYDSRAVIKAAELFARDASRFKQNPHYVYDLVDFTRQAVAEAGRIEAACFSQAVRHGDKTAYANAAEKFMNLMSVQDTLLSTIPAFCVDSWIQSARKAAASENLADAMERDARKLITTWGSRNASETGRLHDYANREWSGLLGQFYYPRWKLWFDSRLENWESGVEPQIDFYAIEKPWTESTASPVTVQAPPDAVDYALKLLKMLSEYAM
ncbi:MAG: alpha-N-acetylglucosaminidase [Firmicutes bacterium]|nr:alpha-N-acetylglucosaminidase [Bacillota bacterium]MCM1401934.1 alpha-N-acetylglucosaminidase [Bacteroides sp.]MCM1477820.1 alpha-N-acetylglucosaminidase [Bacteroides sp.]